MSQSSQLVSKAIELQRNTLENSQQAMEQAVELPLQQSVALQRNAAQFMLNGLEVGNWLGTQTVEFTRDALDSYIETVENAARDTSQLTERGIQNVEAAGMHGLESTQQFASGIAGNGQPATTGIQSRQPQRYGQTSPEWAPIQGASPPQMPAYEAPPRQAPPQGAPAQQPTAQGLSPQQATQQQAPPQQATQQQTPPQQATQQQAPPQQAMQQQTPPQQAVQRQTPPQQAMQQQAPPQTAPPQRTQPQQFPPQQFSDQQAPTRQLSTQRLPGPQARFQQIAPQEGSETGTRIGGPAPGAQRPSQATGSPIGGGETATQPSPDSQQPPRRTVVVGESEREQETPTENA
jgi:hypothetical protein